MRCWGGMRVWARPDTKQRVAVPMTPAMHTGVWGRMEWTSRPSPLAVSTTAWCASLACWEGGWEGAGTRISHGVTHPESNKPQPPTPTVLHPADRHSLTAEEEEEEEGIGSALLGQEKEKWPRRPQVKQCWGSSQRSTKHVRLATLVTLA